MRVTKGKAFFFSLISIFIIYATSAFLMNTDSSGAAYAAIVALASFYIAGNVADNGVKGKFFNDGLKS